MLNETPPTLSTPSILAERYVNHNQTLSALLAPLIQINWDNENSSIFTIPEESLILKNPNSDEDPQTGNFDILNGDNSKSENEKYLQFQAKLLNWENVQNQENQNQELSQSHCDIMATIMNTKLAQNANNGETYCQYHYDCQDDSLITATMVKENLKPEKTASQIETVSKNDLEKFYLEIGKDLAGDYPGGILIFDPKNPDPKIPDYAKKNLESSLSQGLMINGGKPRFLIINIDAFYRYVNGEKFSLERSKSFMKGVFFNEWYDTNNAKNEISREGESAGQFSSAAFTIATESAINTENPEVEFVRKFVEIVGGTAIAYQMTDFKPGIIPDLDIPIISDSLLEGAKKLGFPSFKFIVQSGGIIPTGMPNINTSKNDDTFAGYASQLLETSGVFKLDTKKGNDTVAMIVDREKVEVNMGGGKNAFYCVIKPGCKLIVNGGKDRLNQITAIVLPGGRIEYNNFAQELTTIIDLNPKVGDGPRIASSINSDFDLLTNPQFNPQANSQFPVQQTSQENTQPFILPLDFQLNSNSSLGSVDYQITQKSFDPIDPKTSEIQNSIQNSNSPINSSIFDNSGNSNNYSNSSNNFDLAPNGVNLNAANLILPRV